MGPRGFEPRTTSARFKIENSGISASDWRIENGENVLELFEDYLILERGLFKGTARNYVRTIKYVLKHTSKELKFRIIVFLENFLPRVASAKQI